jgi:hypothetical protein
LVVPPRADLAPVLEPRILKTGAGPRTRVWLFQDFDRVTPLSDDATPDRAVEAVLEPISGS